MQISIETPKGVYYTTLKVDIYDIQKNEYHIAVGNYLIFSGEFNKCQRVLNSILDGKRTLKKAAIKECERQLHSLIKRGLPLY